MCKRSVHNIHGAFLIALLTLALVATGFAHRIPGTSDTAIEAYVAGGGALSELCSDLGADGKEMHADCPVCHIVGSAMLPDAPQSVAAVNYVYVATVVAPRESRAIRTVLDPARGMRAPPLA